MRDLQRSAQKSPRRPLLPVKPDGVPASMRAQRRWVIWREERRSGKLTKTPFRATDPAVEASSTDPTTWASFDDALAAYEDGKADGIGFVLGDGFFGLDRDHCVIDGSLDDEGRRWLSVVPTYAEWSVHGDGVHLLGRGTLPAGRRKKGGSECYDTGRYFAVTGHRLAEAPTELTDCTAALVSWFRSVFGTSGHGNGSGALRGPAASRQAAGLDDDEVITAGHRAGNGAKFGRLWRGDWTADYGDQSQSEADAALCAMLAFYTGRDAAQMDRVFRRSGLMRDKWNERHGTTTYGAATIAFAIECCAEVYGNRVRPAPTEATSTDAPKPRLNAGNRDLPAITADATRALCMANVPPVLFHYGGQLVRLEHDEHGQPLVRPLTEDMARHHLARAADWFTRRERKDGSVDVAALPPMAVVRDILASPRLALPILERIVEAPVFDRAGRLQTTPGYHPDARLLFAPAPGFTVPAVPPRPSTDAIARARALLLEELLGDFPFVGEAERAHALSLPLTFFLREVIAGPTPLHLIEKPAPGTGGTLLAEVLLWPAMGRPLGALTEGRDEDEWRKRITAKLLTSPTAIEVDNIRRPLTASALASAITQTIWEDRQLGVSVIVRVPVRCVWVATGNNPRLSNELTRRSIRIRLDAGCERPWLRERFRHPDLRAWAAEHRGALVAAALTLGQAWMAAGQPQGEIPLGMFERWSAVIGGVLEVAGVPGFLTNLDDFYEASDVEAEAYACLVGRWWDRFASQSVGVSQLWDLVKASDDANPVDLPLGDGSDRSQRTRLGNLLKELRGRVFDGHRIDPAGSLHRAKLWRLVPVPVGAGER